MVWKKDEHAYTWSDLDGHVAECVLCAPRTGGDPTGSWPHLHARVIGYLMRNVRGKPWMDSLTLLAAVMAAGRRDVAVRAPEGLRGARLREGGILLTG